MIHRLILAVMLTVFGIATVTAEVNDSHEVSFGRDVRPILSDNCFFCHGPDEADRQADLRLDHNEELDLEELIHRVTSSDPDLVMPPPESNKSLTEDQKRTLRRWAESGGEYEVHWAYTPLADPPVPSVKSQRFSNSPIDQFVAARFEAANLSAMVAADRRTLIRRLALDLTGLPPSLDQVDQFLSDRDPDAYERLVDRLLDSPHYGEHMARYWMDVVRFADTNGLHHDHYREMTPYRDWVIRAFNQNMPFDEFVVAQIAGDLYSDPTTDQLIASGFNRLHLIIDRGTALPEESFTRNVIDRVSAVGTAFMGLTLECAVCHDHKYDPITQRDFYQLYAFFNNFDGGPETGGRSGLDFMRGLQKPYLELPSDEQRKELDRINAEIKGNEIAIGKLQQSQKGSKGSNQADSDRLKSLQQDQRLLHIERDQIIQAIPATLIMKERDEVRPAHILIRGNYDSPGERVERDTPSFLPPSTSSGPIKTRMDLAKWLTSPDQPLTARVVVNRFWQQLFGVGLVKTSSDFGAQGEPPSHPELLDHLATQFVSSGWDVKALMRSIVLSETYRQTAVASPDSYRKDPENRLLTRGSRYRFDAEVIRDQILSVSGLLNPQLYGQSVKPPQPSGLWEIVAMPNSYPKIHVADQGDKIYRRSLYSFWKRALPPPQMTIFDAPTRESCTARRERTNTPLQALVLMNEPQYFHAASTLAAELLQRSNLSLRQKIDLGYQQITTKLPSDATSGKLLTAFREFQSLYQSDSEAVSQFTAALAKRPTMANRTSSGVDAESSLPEIDSIDHAAMTMIVHSLFNLDATKTRE